MMADDLKLDEDGPAEEDIFEPEPGDEGYPVEDDVEETDEPEGTNGNGDTAEPEMEEEAEADLEGEPAQEAEPEPEPEPETPKEKTELKDKTTGNRKGTRFHPYKERSGGVGADKKSFHRNRVFISNIPYDMKWQAIKDLMREKVGEVTYVELFKDGDGKSRGCGVVEFRDEEFVKKAVEVMMKHDLNGRPLNIKEDPDGEHARRVMQRAGGMFPDGRGGGGGPGGMNLPPAVANNPHIPPEVINMLHAGRLGTTVFVANLDFKVGWKKLKEVFGLAGVVKRADVKEDKDGKSRGMGTVTFEQPMEAVQAISMFNGQMLFDRQMHVKIDDKSLPPEDIRPVERAPQLPRGLGGIGMGLGPGGQPINANRVGGGGGMATGGMGGAFGMDGMGGFGGRDMPRMGGMGDMYRGGMDRDFGRTDMSMSRGFGDAFPGMGAGFGGVMAGAGMMRASLGGGMGNLSMDRMSGGMDAPMNRGFGGSYGGFANRAEAIKGGCQIFVRNLPYDLSWQKLKEKFMMCGQVMFAEIKMEGGKSKGCGTVRFDSPASAENACRMMNGTRINGREVDVRIDRNA